MITDGKEIKIRLMYGAARAWLCLQGTILSYRERSWSEESILDIPIELVAIEEPKPSNFSHLIAGLLSLLFLPLIGGLVVVLLSLFSGHVSETTISVCVGTSITAGFFLSMFLLSKYYILQIRLIIRIAPNNATICFGLEKKRESELRELMEEIARRKALVSETISYPMQIAARDTIYRPWRRMIVQTFVFLCPTLMTEIPWLLLAGVIPIGLCIYSELLGIKDPPALRKAMRYYRKREWAKARDAIKALIDSNPECKLAKPLLVEFLMRLEDFNEAESALARFQNEIDTETLQSIQQDIIVRKGIYERKKPIVRRSVNVDAQRRAAQP